MALSKVPYTDYQTVVTAANMNAIQDEIISTTSLALCNTAPGTASKSAVLQNFVLSTGAAVKVKFADTNTAANPTLNINSTGAQAIMQYGATPVGTTPNTSWNAGDVVELVYDGTNWVIVGKNLQAASSTQAGLLSSADKGVIDTVGDVSDLDTTAQSTVVDAINEVNAKATNTSGTGYCKMPDGTLMHWGSVSIPRAAGLNTADSAVLSPAFVNTPVQVFSTYPTTAPHLYSHECALVSGKIRAYLYNGTSAFDTNGAVYYFAIGRWK